MEQVFHNGDRPGAGLGQETSTREQKVHYDSMLPYPALYRLWLREEVKGLNRSLAGVDTQLLAGLSVSREETRTHHPRTENMASGLAGICAGYAALPAGSLKLEGIAIYAAWEADEADWALWERWISQQTVAD